jgi:hypothetical protein
MSDEGRDKRRCGLERSVTVEPEEFFQNVAEDDEPLLLWEL